MTAVFLSLSKPCKPNGYDAYVTQFQQGHVFISSPGLLWNLSSAEDLKPDLLKNALTVLMERVILPQTTAGPNQSDGNGPDSAVFLHTTGCLR